MRQLARRICDHKALLLALTLAAAPGAQAQDLSFYGGVGLSATTSDDPGTRVNLNGYLGVERGPLYLEASADHYNDAEADTVDLTLGYGDTTAGDLSYDLSYTTGVAPDLCCASFDLSLGKPLTAGLTGGLDLSLSPGDHLSEAHLSLDYDLNDLTRLSASVGALHEAGLSDRAEWEIGLNFALRDDTALSLNYADGSHQTGRLGFTLSWERQLFGP